MLRGDPGPASPSFDGSTGRSTSACGMGSGKIALDHRVKSARTVERDTGHSRPRSSVADDMQAQGGGGGGGRVRSAMRRQRDYEMVLKNSWRRKENHSGHPMHQYSGGDWDRAPDWGMWRQCGSSSGTRASMGGYPRGRPWRGDCWRLQGTGTSKGRSRKYCPELGWRRKQVSYSPWYEDRIGFSQNPWRNCDRKRTVGGYGGHHQGSCVRWRPARESSRGRKWSALHWRHCRYATCYASERHGQPTAAGWDNLSSKEKRVAQESRCRMWGRGPRDGYASSMRRDAGGGGMVQWHTISPPRAHWKPGGSSWSLGRATDH